MDNKEVEVYPNPATNQLIINGINKVEKIEVYNIVGQSILIENNKTQVDVSGLNSGVYFLKVNDTFVKKFIKE